jgi:hypothetical protein
MKEIPTLEMKDFTGWNWLELNMVAITILECISTSNENERPTLT